MINIIEIKARCDQQGDIREQLLQRGADYRGLDHQVDTYFQVREGRLKLREGNIENHLIQYHRDDQAGPKHSRVRLHAVPPGDPLKAMLIDALGVLAVVDKQREIYFIDNVKFHLDTVVDLGTFVEIEAIDTRGERSREDLWEQCQYYLKLFAIPSDALVAVSYSDLLIAQRTAG
ncbi:MAG: class IV adenylate cyclase [Bacteroidota bacterium]